jgi:DNA-binding XRE family transcriptional regulator
MSLPCALIIADNVRRPRGPLLQRVTPGTIADQLTARKGLGEVRAQREVYGGRGSIGIASRLPLYTLAFETLWIKEVGCHSLLRVASIHARFGRTVRTLRAKAGYSQESFADAIHIHRTSMGTLERGDGNPTLETILKIARGLDVSLTELFLAVEKDTG